MTEIKIDQDPMDQSDTQASEPGKPIVLSLKKKKKRKGRYSRGLEEIQRQERHFTRATHRLVRATEKGISSYRRSSLKSSRKKRDGVIRDFIPNSGKALSRTLRIASPLPNDIARAMDTRLFRRGLKRQIRTLRRTLR
ncbi:MAG: hypothetical protein MUO76_10380 [Anaerolineaceae bacterium]|nr:hypothetical protein [Anaerolineaceae bacterium]